MSSTGPPHDATVSPSQGTPVAPAGRRADATPEAGTVPQTPPPESPAHPLRCPHCRDPLRLAEGRAGDMLCPACGSTFRVQDTPRTSAGPARRLGRFQLLQQVGAGAFGAVWKARDTELGRTVALKLPHPGLFDSPEGVERFYREARAAAQLRHPGIVPVHEVATLEGRPAIVSDFIEGVTLRDLMHQRRPSFREAAALIADLAEALDHAHGLGLVHRDIKPGNVMMEYRRDVPGDGPGAGRPLVMDFGLALRDEAEVTLTLDGQVVGTPAYMSPEQAAGRGHHVDARSDVYSLGVVLYELLCGELPFRGTNQMILFQALCDEPRPPRRLNDKVPRDLETVCLKAMAKEPGRRYPTARALADDLRRFLAGHPVQARPAGALLRAALWARRRPAAAGLLFASLLASLALVALAVGGVYHSRLQGALHEAEAARGGAEAARSAEEEQRRAAEEARGEADGQRRDAEAYLYLHRVGLARSEWRDNNVANAERLLAACPPAARRWEWYYVAGLCHTELLELRGHAGGVLGVVFSPQGDHIAGSGEDGTVRLWDAATGREQRTFRPRVKGRITGVAFSPDGRLLAGGGLEVGVTVWDRADGREVFARSVQGEMSGLAFSPDGRRLVCGDGKVVRAWDLATGREEFALAGHTEDILAVVFSRDGTKLASAGFDHVVKVWDVAGRRELFSFAGHTYHVHGLAFDPDGRRLASAGRDRTVRLWDLDRGRELHTLRGHGAAVWGVAFSPDGRHVASASHDQTARVWDVTSGQERRCLKGHVMSVGGVAFHPDGRRLATAGADGVVKVWDWQQDQEARVVQPAGRRADGLAFSPDGRLLAVLDESGDVTVREAASGREALRIPGGASPRAGLAFSPDGRLLAVGDADGLVHLMEADTGRAVRVLRRHEQRVWAVAFSPDGRLLASAGGDRAVRVWDAATGRPVRTLEGPAREVTCVAFSPDGRLLAGGSWDGTARVWDVAGGDEVARLAGHTAAVYDVAFRDGRLLATAGYDRVVKLWDVGSGRETATLRGHGAEVVAVAFSPDSSRLVSGSLDKTLKVWDPERGQEVLTLRGHPGMISRVAFSPDGRLLASACWDGVVKVWDATPRPER